MKAIVLVATVAVGILLSYASAPATEKTSADSSALTAVPAALLTGTAAQEFIAKQLGANPKFRAAQQRAHRRLEGKGWRAAGSATVIRLPRTATTAPQSLRASILHWFTPTLHAQDTQTDEGIVVTTPFDDGNDQNIESNMYVEIYDGYGSYMSLDSQMFVPDDGSRIYRQWASGDKGTGTHEPIPIGFGGIGAGTCAPTLRPVALQSSGTCACVVHSGNGAAGCILDKTIQDSWEFCAAAAGVCTRRSWGAWFQCTGAGCGTAFGGYLIRHAKSHFQNCRAAGIF